MIAISRMAWAIAFALSIAVHAALAMGFSVPKQGVVEPPAGAPISVSGSLESVLGGAVTAKEATKEVVQPVLAAHQPTAPKALTVRSAEPIAVREVGERFAAVSVRPKRTAAAKAKLVSSPAVARSVVTDPITSVATVRPAGIEALRPVSVSAELSRVVPVSAQRRVKPVASKPVTRVAPTKRSVNRKRKLPAQTKSQRKRPRERKRARLPKSSKASLAGTKRRGAAGRKRGGKRGRSVASAGSIASYGARVRSRILANRPRSSGAGRVVVSFAVSSGGGLRYARVVRASGNASLDQAAVAAVRRSAPFPRPPAGASPRQLSFTIPFSSR